jgi:hypothetical protein
MTTSLDRAIRSSLSDIIAAAPQSDDQPMRLVTVNNETSTRRPYLAVAASLVVLAGLGGLVAIGTNDDTPVSPAAAPIATDDSAAPEPVTTLPIDTATPVGVDTTVPHGCTSPGAQALVPDVAGIPYAAAIAILTSEGLEPNALREVPPPGETATDADYAVVRQNAAPGTRTPCGTIVDITVAYRPGILYVVQEGDTYQSIAVAQGISVEQLLGFSGLTVAELEASGQSPTTPLTLGQALRLSNSPAS